MSGRAAKVLISEKQQVILQFLARSRTVSSRLQQRAKIVLLVFDGQYNIDITEQVGLNRVHVGKWPARWKA